MYFKIINGNDFERKIAVLGYSKKSFAKSVGIGTTTIYRILNNQKRVSPKIAKKISDFLGEPICENFK